MRYLLDSSAWLAHLFGESGIDEVTWLFDDPKDQVHVSALSIPEVFTRFKSLGIQARWAEIRPIYAELFTNVLAADSAVAHQAVHLHEKTPERLPTIDALIVATAVVHQLTLVHRDPHMGAIPNPVLRQKPLPR